ncbi:MAG TPA: hypothetical protein VK129_06245 [Terriglobales bacterium]|nr:hypothetical protein [Terriglobales bacterium]
MPVVCGDEGLSIQAAPAQTLLLAELDGGHPTIFEFGQQLLNFFGATADSNSILSGHPLTATWNPALAKMRLL